MTSGRWSAAACCSRVSPSRCRCSSQAQAQQRVIYVSALDEKGAPVAGLGPSDFVVREDKVAREVLSVAPATEPMQIALLVDNSQAAEPYIRDLREALTGVHQRDRRRPARREAPGRGHHASASGRRSTPTTRTDLQQAVKGAQRIFATARQRRLPARRHHRNVEGHQEARVAAPGHRRGHHGRPRAERSRRTRRCSNRCATSGAAFHVIVVGRPGHHRPGPHDGARPRHAQTGGRYDTVLDRHRPHAAHEAARRRS